MLLLRPDKTRLAAIEELELLLDDKDFRSPPRRRKLLRYLVEETLAGRGAELTAVPIAQSVFGRNETFDHQSDPVVRIEAHRLRNDLASYYALSERKNGIRISIPKGRYAAHFAEVVNESEEDIAKEPDHRPAAVFPLLRISSFFIAIAVLIGLPLVFGIGLYWGKSDPAISSAQHGPAVIVAPFTALGDVDSDVADRITSEVIAALMRFSGIRVLASNGRYQTGHQATSSLSYVVDGDVASVNSDVRIHARLVRIKDDQVIWSKDYAPGTATENSIVVETEVAGDIAARLGQTFGVISNDLIENMDRLGPDLGSYYCMLKAQKYRQNPPGEALYPEVQECLEQTVAAEPNYADAWSMLSLVYNDAIRFNRIPPDKIDMTRSSAFEAASRALALDPQNTLGAVALSAIYFYQGQHDLAEKYGRLAVENNPNDPDLLTLLGFRLLMRGKFEEATPLLERAIMRSVVPPGYNYQLLAVARLMSGDAREMLEMAQRSTIDGSALSYSLVAMANGLLGDKLGAAQALSRMNELSPDYNPIARLKIHQATDEILNAMADAMDRAGWRQSTQALAK